VSEVDLASVLGLVQQRVLHRSIRRTLSEGRQGGEGLSSKTVGGLDSSKILEVAEKRVAGEMDVSSGRWLGGPRG
jgi:hypothetical protein